MSDLDAYGSVIDGLRDQAKECKVSLLLTQCCVRITCLFFHQSCIIDKLATGIILLRSFVSDFFLFLLNMFWRTALLMFVNVILHIRMYIIKVMVPSHTYKQSDCAVQRPSK